MKINLLSFLTVVAGMAIASISMADIVNNTGAGFNIPDGDMTGASSSIVIGANETITDVDLTLFGLNHTWMGDLVVTLSGPGGTATIMNRTGSVTGVGSGDSSDFGGDYTFSDGGANLWSAAFAATGAEIIAPGIYSASTTGANIQLGTQLSLNAIFGGTLTAGTWTLTVSDNSADDTGVLGGWGLSIISTAIPEPGSLGLIGLAGLALAARRRR
jgi:subtilisin-like proprotein convertase family protein